MLRAFILSYPFIKVKKKFKTTQTFFFDVGGKETQLKNNLIIIINQMDLRLASL
jgi:hypothetical protein